MAGSVVNKSSKTLWVVETDSDPAVAHKLASNHKSQENVGADGLKAVDGTPISGHLTNNHRSWWKITDISTANITNDGTGLNNDCILCSAEDENEFGTVTYLD